MKTTAPVPVKRTSKAISTAKPVRAKWLASILLLSFAATPMADAASYGDFVYTFLTTNTVRIDAYTGTASVVSIPSSISNRTVVSITGFGFRYGMTSVTIPSSVTNIEGMAFEYCTNLASITIPGGVTSIKYGTFQSCYNLTNVTIPSSITDIADSSFEYCRSLPRITIPGSVKAIGINAFHDCRSLASITIPDSVTRIGGNALASCGNLTSVTIGSSVTNVGDSAFTGTKIHSITIPNSVTSIGSSAFSLCRDLNNATIGTGVTNLNNDAFYGTSGLISICFNGNAPAGTNVFRSSVPTVYYVQGTTGWTNPWNGRPTSNCQQCDEEFTFTAFSPADQEENVFWDDPKISAVFTGNIDANTLNSNTFYFCYSGSTNPIPGSFSVTNKTVRFTPSAPLKSTGQRIFATIKGGTTGVRSATGGNLWQSYYWNFSTMPSVTVHCVSAQVVDDMDWVIDKDASVRIQAFWGGSDYTAVSLLKGKVTVAWNDATESVKPEFRWANWDGNPYANVKNLKLTSTEWYQGNAAVFSTPQGTMPLSMINPPGTKNITATIELRDTNGRTKQFTEQTTVTVRPLASENAWNVYFIPLSVGSFTSSVPTMGTIARTQMEFIKKIYPLPESAIADGWQSLPPDIYSYWNHKNPLNAWDNQYLAALAADMDDYRESAGMDVVIGVVPDGWLAARAGGAPGMGGANWFTLNGLPVVFIEETVMQHVTAHEVGHIYAGHSRADFNSSGFDPVLNRWYALGLTWFRGDFMDAYSAGFGVNSAWVNRQTYGALMNHFVGNVVSQAAAKVSQATPVLGMDAPLTNSPVMAVSGILIQSGTSCTSEIARIYTVTNKTASTNNLTGDYYVEAQNATGGLLSSVRINPVFNTTNAAGAQIAYFKVYFSNPSSISKVVVKKLTLAVGSLSRPLTAPTVAITAPAAGSTNTGPLTVSWNGTGSGTVLTYNVFYRPETNQPWSILGLGKTNKTITAGIGDIACGSNAQIRVVINDGFNTAEAISGVFRVLQRPFVISCTPSNSASSAPIETDVEFIFSTPMIPTTISTNTVSLKDSSGTKVSGSVFYDSYAQRAVFIPEVPLANISVYTARVESVVTSIYGQTMTNAFISAFRTCTDTNDYPAAICANGVNTVMEAYIAGLDPNDPESEFKTSAFGKELRWNAVSGRVYSVYWTSNLLSGFQSVKTNIMWPQCSFTNSTGTSRGYYKIDVRLP